MNFSHALAALRRRWPALVAFVLLGVSLGVVHATVTEPTYKSTTAVIFTLERGQSVGELAQGTTYLEGLVESYADVATSRLVLGPVINELQLRTTPESLARRVRAEARPDTTIMDISVTDRSREGAARIASTVADELTDAVAALAPRSSGRLAVVTVTTITPATIPTSPASPKPVRDVALGLIAGLLLGALAVAVLDAVAAPVDNRESAVAAAGAPVVAAVPRDRSARRHALPVLTGPTLPRTEGIWMLRANLQLRQPVGRSLAVVITSALPSEGRTGIAVNLAIAMSHAAQRVLLIDADLVRPRVAQLLDLDAGADGGPNGGLAAVLVGEARFEDVVQTWIGPDGGRSRLSVVTAGTSSVNPSELLASEAMEGLLSTVKLDYDVVVIDTAPLLTLAGSAILAARADGALLVVDSRRTRMRQVTEAVTRLRLAGAQVLGVVLNNTRKGLSRWSPGASRSRSGPPRRRRTFPCTGRPPPRPRTTARRRSDPTGPAPCRIAGTGRTATTRSCSATPASPMPWTTARTSSSGPRSANRPVRVRTSRADCPASRPARSRQCRQPAAPARAYCGLGQGPRARQAVVHEEDHQHRSRQTTAAGEAQDPPRRPVRLPVLPLHGEGSQSAGSRLSGAAGKAGGGRWRPAFCLLQLRQLRPGAADLLLPEGRAGVLRRPGRDEGAAHRAGEAALPHAARSRLRRVRLRRPVRRGISPPGARPEHGRDRRPFDDDTFDLILCSHVLEHVVEDDVAIRELVRVVKPGGTAILQVPISKNSAETFEDFSVVGPEEREQTFGQFDHVRIYGQDYDDRLRKGGFTVDRVNLSQQYVKYGVNPDEDLFVCSK